ncbi:MAG: hypothetical protein VB070_11420 [Clostridiaceae bacterium]|nr:hypothetical protein [Clostridiaceae bacterium]
MTRQFLQRYKILLESLFTIIAIQFSESLSFSTGSQTFLRSGIALRAAPDSRPALAETGPAAYTGSQFMWIVN